MADENKNAFPGFMAGGPNMYMQDKRNLKQQGVVYQDSIPAKACIDNSGSYASDEICINWNAALVFVRVFLDESPGER
jgi:endoglucanase